jgi:hypothetical protein
MTPRQKLAFGTNVERVDGLKQLLRSKADTSYLNLSNLVIPKGTFKANDKITGANLTGTKVHDDLIGVDMSDSWSNGRFALLGRTNHLILNGGVHYGMTARNLDNAQMMNGVFAWADFSNASAVNAKARNSAFFGSNKNGMDITGADYSETDLQFVSMDDVISDNTQLTPEKGPLSMKRNRSRFATLNQETVLAGANVDEVAKVADIGLDFTTTPTDAQGQAARRRAVHAAVAYSYVA